MDELGKKAAALKPVQHQAALWLLSYTDLRYPVWICIEETWFRLHKYDVI